MIRQLAAAAVWAFVLAGASVLAAANIWAAAFPLAILLTVAVVLWVGNELANRLERLNPNEGPRYTGRRHR